MQVIFLFLFLLTPSAVFALPSSDIFNATLTGAPRGACPLIPDSLTARGPTCFTNSGYRLQVSHEICKTTLDEIIVDGQDVRAWDIPDWHFHNDDKSCNIRFFARKETALGQRFSARDVFDTVLEVFYKCDREAGGPGFGGVSDLMLGGDLDDGWRIVAIGGKNDQGMDMPVGPCENDVNVEVT